ncbi:MAG: hypothetical protein JW741_03845 [Sedimentisphaerales bacterium]|nr:hypothetical protein [Sedimentisphaerales bacterium]
MNKPKRWALRAAACIRQSLANVHSSRPSLAFPETAWSQCARLARQIDKAAGRGWTLAARRLRGELAYSIGTCRRHLEQVACELDGNDIPPRLPTPREVFRDLIALEDEFDEVRWDRKGILSAVTEPVILDSIDLGRFEIALDAGCGPHREWGTYEVIALDANSAASDSDVTHPHVQAGQLCEGEGRAAIRSALKEGRVLDFFVLVRQILQTYNPASAYVRLERWNGVRCPDCGELVGEEDCVPCGRCEGEICGECVLTCAGCDQPFCSECIESCSGCEERYCPACLDACAGCGQPFCQECLTDEKCSSCLEASREENPEPQSQPACGSSRETQNTRATLQPLRVGEAPVSA